MIRTAGRLLRNTNAYHLLNGTTVHRYTAIFGQFRLSYWACINLALGHLLYWSGLYTHYVHADQVHLVRYLSELLHDCIYAHLFVGILTYAIVAIEYHRYLAFSSRVSDALHANAGFRRRPGNSEAANASAESTIKRWWKDLRCDGLELFVYYKMWVNTVILVALSAYSLYHIDLRTLTRTKIMLIVALAYPHVLVANVLRFYTVHAIIVNAMWAEENVDMEQRLARSTAAERDNRKASCCVALDAAFGAAASPQSPTTTQASAASAADAGATSWRQHFVNIELYQRLYADLNRLIQLQVGLLFKKHALIVFIGVHVYVKLRLLWHTVLSEVDQHLIRVNFVTFFVMMMNDYVCLLVVSQVCQRQVRL